MLKKLIIFLFLVLLSVYLVIAMTIFNVKPDNQVCEGLELIINDSIDYGFITKNEIIRLLKTKKISPMGKDLGSINTRQLENELKSHPLIGNAECYYTSSNRIGIEITQRLPILRIMASNGDNYYIDNQGTVMPVPNSAANVAIVTGYADKAFVTKELYELGMFLQKHPLWKAQIQQINITSSKEIELIPHVGDHIIFLGKPGNYKDKFDRLKTFYKKGLNEVGWNKYSRISLEFDNLIFCTKKQK